MIPSVRHARNDEMAENGRKRGQVSVCQGLREGEGGVGRGCEGQREGSCDSTVPVSVLVDT